MLCQKNGSGAGSQGGANPSQHAPERIHGAPYAEPAEVTAAGLSSTRDVRCATLPTTPLATAWLAQSPGWQSVTASSCARRRLQARWAGGPRALAVSAVVCVHPDDKPTRPSHMIERSSESAMMMDCAANGISTIKAARQAPPRHPLTQNWPLGHARRHTLRLQHRRCVGRQLLLLLLRSAPRCSLLLLLLLLCAPCCSRLLLLLSSSARAAPQPVQQLSGPHAQTQTCC